MLNDDMEVSEHHYSTYEELVMAGVEDAKEADEVAHAMEVLSNLSDANRLMGNGQSATAREVELLKVIANMSVAGTDTPAEYVGAAMESLALANAGVGINDLYNNVVAKIKTSINRGSDTFLTNLTALITLRSVSETRVKKLRVAVTHLKVTRADKTTGGISIVRPPQSIFLDGIRYPKSLVDYQTALAATAIALDDFIRNSHEFAVVSAGIVHDFKVNFNLNSPPEEQLLDFENKYKAAWDKTIGKTGSLRKVKDTGNSVFKDGPTMLGGYRMTTKEPSEVSGADYWGSDSMRLSNYGFTIEHDKKPVSATSLVMAVAPLGEIEKTIALLERLLDKITTATNKLNGVKITLSTVYKEAYRNVERVFLDYIAQHKDAEGGPDRNVVELHAPIVRDLYSAQQRAANAVTDSLTVASKLIDGGYTLVERHLSSYK